MSGEEITISYEKGGPSERRRTHLQEAFGFDGNCTLCSLPPRDIQNSDARRLQIQNLDSAIGDSERVMNNPDNCLAGCYRSRVLCEGEDSPETRKIRNLKDNPTGHRNFGASKKLQIAKRLVPKGLDTGEFEKWLWRRGR